MPPGQTCQVCGKHVSMSYECNYCGGHHCSSHRLPENHNCGSSNTQTGSTETMFGAVPGLNDDASSAGRSKTTRAPAMFFGLIIMFFKLIWTVIRTVLSVPYRIGTMLVSRRGVLLLLLVGGVGVLALFGTGTVQPSDVGLDAVGEQVSGVADSLDTSINESKVEEQVHRRVNAQRLDHDLGLLKFNDRLSDVARSHSEHMASADFFAHESPNGTTHRDRITAGGVTCQTTGENIALDNTVDNSDAAEVAASVVQGWMNSEGHRRNILDGRWRSQGIGVKISGDEVYVTQNFCG